MDDNFFRLITPGNILSLLLAVLMMVLVLVLLVMVMVSVVASLINGECYLSSPSLPFPSPPLLPPSASSLPFPLPPPPFSSSLLFPPSPSLLQNRHMYLQLQMSKSALDGYRTLKKRLTRKLDFGKGHMYIEVGWNGI